LLLFLMITADSNLGARHCPSRSIMCQSLAAKMVLCYMFIKRREATGNEPLEGFTANVNLVW